METDDKIRGITLRIAIFFGLTTFTLCIAIFYIESILDDTQSILSQKDSLIEVMNSDLEQQMTQIQQNESEISVLKERLNEIKVQEAVEED